MEWLYNRIKKGETKPAHRIGRGTKFRMLEHSQISIEVRDQYDADIWRTSLFIGGIYIMPMLLLTSQILAHFQRETN